MSSLIVPLASHLCTIKFDFLSHLLVPGDLEEQEQRPNLDPRCRRRLKTSQKPPDYLHLQYLTIYFPVPLRRVFIYLQWNIDVNVSRVIFTPFALCIPFAEIAANKMTEMPSTSSRDEIHMPLENILVFYWQRFGSGKFLSLFSVK